MEHDRKPEDLGVLAPLAKPAVPAEAEVEVDGGVLDPAHEARAPATGPIGPVDPLARARAFMHYADDDLRPPEPEVEPEPTPAPADDYLFPVTRKAPAPLDDDAPPPPPGAPKDDPKQK